MIAGVDNMHGYATKIKISLHRKNRKIVCSGRRVTDGQMTISY